MMRNIAVVLSGRDAGLARTLGAAAGAIRQFDTTVTGMGTRSGKILGGLKFALQAIGVAAAVALGAAVAAAVSFEGRMRNVNTILRLGETEFRAMSAAVIEMSTRLPQSANTLAEGLYQIVSSGFQGADALEILEVSATAASAGLTDTENAAMAVVGVLNAYGLTADDAAHVSDILFRTVELGVLTFEELTQQLGDVNAGAAAAGISIEEVGSAIATMTLSGLNAAEATTSLNRLIRAMIKPNDALAETFRKLGHESGLAALEERGLHGVIEALRVATGGQIDMLMRLFPEIRAARGAFALMTAGGTVYNRVVQQMNDETITMGATQRAFNEQMKGLGKQFEVFKNQVIAAGIAIGARLIPMLRSAMQWAQRVGPQIADGFRSAWQAAQPAIQAIGNALREMARVIGIVIDAAAPLARTFAGLAFAGVVAGLTAVATALGALAGFLADHPALVRAVAAVYGAVLVGRILTAAAAFVRLQAGLLATRGAFLAMMAFGPGGLISNIASRVGMLGAAITNLRIGNFTTSIGLLRGAFAGLGGVLAGGALIGGLYAFTTAMEDSKRKAKEMVSGLKEQFDLETLAGLKQFVAASSDELATLDEDFHNMVGSGSGLGTAFRRLIEDISPLPNKMSENVASTNELREAQERARQRALMWDHDINTLSNTLGMSRGEIQAWLKQLEDYDPMDTAQTTGFLADEIRVMALEAAHASPAASALADAVETMGDPTATAADRIEALDSTIEGLIGSMLEVSNAAIGFEEAIDGISEAVAENGTNLDITSEAGREVAKSINSAAEAAIAHSQAVAEETGSVAEGVDVLKKHRQQLIDQMVATGFSREAAEQYIATLGLTPENISTLVQLGGVEEAIFSAEQMQETLRLVNLAKVNPRVNIDSSLFDEDTAKIGVVLAQIAAANPEATVYMNGKPFQATAEQVQAWALMWDASTPEAAAILSIIDPQGKFATLQEAAANWDKASPTATANADISPADQAFANAAKTLAAWDQASATADVNADNSRALADIATAQAHRAAWDRARGTADINANKADADKKFQLANAARTNWDRSSGTADVNAKDNASNIINNVARLLAGLHDKTVTVTTHFVQRGAPGPQIRLGGVVEHAQHGYLQAGVVRSPTVMFGERETGGEAFVPRYGNPNRSRMILAQAADWYGLQLVPKGVNDQTMSITDMRTEVNVTVHAKAIMDGKTLVKAIQDTTRMELAEHDRKLLRSLKSS